MPAAPFKRILEKHVREVTPNGHCDDGLSGAKYLAQACGLPERRIWGILNGQKSIAFHVADRIVTNLVGPMLWWEDEELNEIYMSVDLAYLDLTDPLTGAGSAEANRKFIVAFDENGSVKQAAAALGLDLASFTRRTKNALALAGRDWDEELRLKMKSRHQFCPKGHDTFETGRYKDGTCKVCKKRPAA